MEDLVMLAETLFDSPCFVIDALPMRVPEKSPGQYSELESCFHTEALFRSFAVILLKINCYYDLHVLYRETWTKNPSGADLAAWVMNCLDTREQLTGLLSPGEMMISLSGDDNHMTVYNPTEELLELIRMLAASEGLFVWEGIS